MRRLYRAWDTPDSLFGSVAVVGFLLVQVLDGMFTYLGVAIWGPGIEANPLISSAMGAVGVVYGVAGAKAVAMLSQTFSAAVVLSRGSASGSRDPSGFSKLRSQRHCHKARSYRSTGRRGCDQYLPR